MNRRSLPIANPCDAFRPSPGRTFCPKCEKHVHDLSEMTPRELARFVEANRGERICVAYRAKRDGTIVLRPEPRAIGLAIAALGLAACTGYAPELEHPDERCHDANGYEIDCRTARDRDVRVVPPVEEITPSEAPSEPKPVEPKTIDFDEPGDVEVGDIAVPDTQVTPIGNEIGPTVPLAGAVMIDEAVIAKARRESRRDRRRHAREERRKARLAKRG